MGTHFWVEVITIVTLATFIRMAILKQLAANGRMGKFATNTIHTMFALFAHVELANRFFSYFFTIFFTGFTTLNINIFVKIVIIIDGYFNSLKPFFEGLWKNQTSFSFSFLSCHQVYVLLNNDDKHNTNQEWSED